MLYVYIHIQIQTQTHIHRHAHTHRQSGIQRYTYHIHAEIYRHTRTYTAERWIDRQTTDIETHTYTHTYMHKLVVLFDV